MNLMRCCMMLANNPQGGAGDGGVSGALAAPPASSLVSPGLGGGPGAGDRGSATPSPSPTPSTDSAGGKDATTSDAMLLQSLALLARLREDIAVLVAPRIAAVRSCNPCECANGCLRGALSVCVC